VVRIKLFYRISGGNIIEGINHGRVVEKHVKKSADIPTVSANVQKKTRWREMERSREVVGG
jgi:hypothetical protein